jgi:hypothetical protein
MPCQRCTCTTLKDRGKHSFLVTAAASAAAAAELFVKNALLAHILMQRGLNLIIEFLYGYRSQATPAVWVVKVSATVNIM